MAPIRMPEAVIGLDVGKSSHWACVATRDGEVLLSAPVANREDDLDSLFGRFPDALVVVDQSRNIGALALARARAAGMSAAYLPGLAAHGAARLFAGDAKTDERDAMVIAKTALGIPDALLPVGDPGPTIAAARALAAQRNFLTCENTRNKNRLRSILLESCPAFEALVDLSDGPPPKLRPDFDKCASQIGNCPTLASNSSGAPSATGLPQSAPPLRAPPPKCPHRESQLSQRQLGISRLSTLRKSTLA